MAKPIKFAFKNTAKGWCINVPAKFTATGKRERRYYPSRAKAEAASKLLIERSKTHGNRSSVIHPLLAEQASAAELMLKPFGATILDAARRYVEQETRLQASTTIEAALDEFKIRKEDRSEKQVQAYKHMTARLLEDFHGRVVSTITGEEIEAHITKWTGGPGSFNQRLRLISAFWTWCAKKPRRWCNADELGHIERAETNAAHIGTLTAKQAEKLLQTAEDHYPETVPAFAVALFTGMRRREIERLDPEDFSEEGITVPATSAKTKRRRFIEMPEPLKAWLKRYPFATPFLPLNWKSKDKAVRRLAGWNVQCSIINNKDEEEIKREQEARAKLPQWPPNALRHTAATMALARGKSIETLVFEHGHSGGLNVLRNHYVGHMTKNEAQKIWGLRPQLSNG